MHYALVRMVSVCLKSSFPYAHVPAGRHSGRPLTKPVTLLTSGVSVR
jgi:hypothetical protein